MASLKLILVVHFLIHILPTALSQSAGNLPVGPGIAECGQYLLPLASCGPFVQGTVPLPAPQCCINLRQLVTQQPGCLCLLLNNSALSSFPINSTLALQLPILCSMQIDTSICSVPRLSTQPLPLSPPPSAPAPQVLNRTMNNSTVAASPAVTVEPRMPGIIGFGFQHSPGESINNKESLMVATLTSFSLLLWAIAL